MKTIYSIGRDPGCDIYLYDDKNVISRNHAILKIGKGGKYFISDQSMNGTYINGIKVTPGAQVPVTRKDVITFAHVAELDWSLIPNSSARILKIVLLSLLAIAAVGGIVFGVVKYLEQAKTPVQPVNNPIPSGVVMEKDEAAKKQEEAEKQERMEWEKKARAAEAKKKAKDTKKSEKPKEKEQKTEETEHVDPIF